MLGFLSLYKCDLDQRRRYIDFHIIHAYQSAASKWGNAEGGRAGLGKAAMQRAGAAASQSPIRQSPLTMLTRPQPGPRSAAGQAASLGPSAVAHKPVAPSSDCPLTGGAGGKRAKGWRTNAESRPEAAKGGSPGFVPRQPRHHQRRVQDGQASSITTNSRRPKCK